MIVHECGYVVTTVEKLNSLIEKNQASIPSTSSQSVTITSSVLSFFFHHTRLPHIDLPKFNGTPSD